MLIPDNLLRLMTPADRKQYGKAGWTIEECQERVDTRLERKLHAEFSGFLRRHEFDMVIHTDPRKKTQLPPGWPDYTILHGGRVLLIEFKVNANRLSEVQELRIAALICDGFTVLVLHDYPSAVDATLEFFSV